MTSSHLTPAPCQWLSRLASALDRRSAPRLALLFLGAVLARGRRTVTSWIRAAGLSGEFRSCYTAVAAAGKNRGKIGVSSLFRITNRVESRSGAVAWGSVSTPRSSNRTGRFPASGFRTRRFTRSLTNRPALRSRETVEPELPVEVGVGEACLPATTHPILRAQPLTHPVADMLGHRLVRLTESPDAEVVGPAP
jgi:hypothetical protein